MTPEHATDAAVFSRLRELSCHVRAHFPQLDDVGVSMHEREFHFHVGAWLDTHYCGASGKTFDDMLHQLGIVVREKKIIIRAHKEALEAATP